MDFKARARERLNRARSSLEELSHRIHANPELGYQEVKASAWLAKELAEAGFQVEPGICGLPTAFLATCGNGPLHIVFCAEYDALPGIGHACGHNIIAAMSAGAGLATASVAGEVGLKVTVMGTPAEEVIRQGGKIVLIERGAFQGVHAAMMAHPAPADVAELPIIAATGFEVRYYGKAAHASAFPELGVNAADAMTIAQTAIGLLRQHLGPLHRVHGIVTKGGDAFNIIPDFVSADYGARARTLDELGDLYQKVLRCFEAGALATGARLEIVGGERPYAQMEHDHEVAALYQRNAEALGHKFLAPTLAARMPASTDMGNVSLVIPAIHPAIGINSLPAVNHQPEFAAHCVTQDADQALYDGALALAWTAIDMATDPAIRDRLLARQVPPET